MRVGLDSRRRREGRVPRLHRRSRLLAAWWNRRRCTTTPGTHTRRVRRCSVSRRGWGASSVSRMTATETPITAFRFSRGDSTSQTERASSTTSQDKCWKQKSIAYYNDNNNIIIVTQDITKGGSWLAWLPWIRSRPIKHTGSYTSTFYDDVFDCDGYDGLESWILCFFLPFPFCLLPFSPSVWEWDNSIFLLACFFFGFISLTFSFSYV